MRIAIAQIATRAADFDGTARRMAEVSRRAADAGADLLVFPVAALCGVTPVQRTDREGFLIDLMECLLGLIDELACPCLLPVLLDTDEAALPEALSGLGFLWASLRIVTGRKPSVKTEVALALLAAGPVGAGLLPALRGEAEWAFTLSISVFALWGVFYVLKSVRARHGFG